jgi:hypothetical protein
MLSYWLPARCADFGVELLCAAADRPGPAGRSTAAGHRDQYAGRPAVGIILMLVSLILFIIGFTMGGLNYVVTVLRGRTRGMTLMPAATVWGIFTATVMAFFRLPGAVRRLRDDVALIACSAPAFSCRRSSGWASNCSTMAAA